MISLLTTGGTIACTTDPTGALVPTVSGEELVDAAGASSEQVRVQDLLQLDSSSITLGELDELIAAVHAELADPRIDGVIVTHGTDSLEETVMALSLMHPEVDKAVAVTGAQRAFDRPDTDGPGNLAAALEAVTRTDGVHLVFGGQTLPARGLTKTHTDELRAFTSPGVFVSDRTVPRTRLAGTQVPIVAAYPGASGALVEAVSAGADGVVVQAMGSGNMSAGYGEAVAKLLRRGVPVVVATRVPFGRVNLTYGGAGGGATLKELGAIGSNGLSAGQARITLLTALAAGVDPAELF